MAYSEILAERVSQTLRKTPKVEAKKMMGGLTFMVDAKMCVGSSGRSSWSGSTPGCMIPT